MTGELKKISIRLLLFVLPFLAVLYALAYVADKGLHKSKMQYFAVWNDIYGSRINADVLINGSSRAFVQYSPRIIDSALGVNSYNLGMDGWTFPMEYTRFLIYLQHNKKPHYVIQNIDMAFWADRKDLFNYQQFLPYLSDPLIRKATSRYEGKFSFADYYFPLFKYNNNLTILREGVFCFFNMKHVASNRLYKGYGPRTMPWDGYFEQFIKAHPQGIDEQIEKGVVDDFGSFLKLCQDSDIKVIFVLSPVLHDEFVMERNAGQVLGLVSDYAKKYNIPFLDYTGDSLCYERRYFYNSQHLTQEGAELFSRKLAGKLKNIIH